MSYPSYSPDRLPQLTSPDTYDTQLRSFVQSELARYSRELTNLLEIRHDLFDVAGTEFSTANAIHRQLYNDPTYNMEFIYHDLGLRNGNSLDYHQTTERYDRDIDPDNEQRNSFYRSVIRRTAQELGFIAPRLKQPTDPLDELIGIQDSYLAPIKEPVEAVVINGAAGMSNLKRVRDAVRNIEQGRIPTNRIILTGGTRPVLEKERASVIEPFHAGATEYESLKNAAQDLLDVTFDGPNEVFPVAYGDNLTASVERATASIGGHDILIEAVEAPYDTTRLMSDGSYAKRINTEEAFLATLPLLASGQEAIVMQSHDAWTPWQYLMGLQIFGRRQQRNVYPAGPFNLNRLTEVSTNGYTSEDITAPQDVVDEMAKTYRQLVQLSYELDDSV